MPIGAGIRVVWDVACFWNTVNDLVRLAISIAIFPLHTECGVTATFRNLPLNSRAGNTQYSFQREHTMNLPRDRFLDLVEPAKASPPFFISGSKRLNKCHGNMSILVDGIAVIIIPLSCKHVFLRLVTQTDSIKEDTELMTRSTYPRSYWWNQQARDSTWRVEGCCHHALSSNHDRLTFGATVRNQER